MGALRICESQYLKEPGYDCSDLCSGLLWVAGTCDRQGRLVECADQYVGEGVDGLAGDRALTHGGAQGAAHEPKAMLGVDLSPCFPPQYGGSVEENDPLYRRCERGIEVCLSACVYLLPGVAR